MIYCDSSATTLQKPPAVAQAVGGAIHTLGAAGRGGFGPALDATRALYQVRQTLAALARLDDPLNVAFTSGATESLGLLIGKLASPADHVITTVLEHNSVLRPLYATGCALSFLNCDDEGRLLTNTLPALLKNNTRLVVCTHGSNLLGSVAPLEEISRFCRAHSLPLVLDAAQTLGRIPFDASLASFTCFSGHKALHGPQGTGGVLAGPGAPAHLYKTGGTGADSFAHTQPARMPDMLEAGTPNLPGLCGLQAGAEYVAALGIEEIRRREAALTRQLLEGAASIPGITLYGGTADNRLPVVALNVGDLPSDEAARRLWERHGIATRPGSHCAPLAHRRFGTEDRGMVRFSFSLYNTADEVDTVLRALAALGREAG